MTLRTLTEDQVMVNRATPLSAMTADRDGTNSDSKGVDGGSDADQGSDADAGDHDGSGGEQDADSSDRGTSDHSADSDSGSHDRSESGSTTTTPRAPDSSDRAPSQPR